MLENRLKGKIIERGSTMDDVARSIGVHPVTFRRKCKGTSSFTLKEIKCIKSTLNLSEEETKFIFFDE